MIDSQYRIPPWRSTAFKVALVYIAAAGLWIVFSDLLIAQFSDDAAELSRWQTAKGWLFVLTTGALLFAFLHRCLRREYETFQQLTTMFDSIPAVVYVAAIDSNELIFVNRFATERFGKDWQHEKCYHYLQQGQQQPCSFCTNAQLLSEGQPGPPISWEFRNTKDGRWYQCLDKAVRWPDGRLVRLEIALDVTERKEMERTKEELLAAVSHEMRTPLTAIAGFSELLLDEPSLSRPVRHHVETIFREAVKMQDLVHTFLEVRRLKSDQARVGYEIVDMLGLLRQAADYNQECTDKHSQEVDCPAGLSVFGNRRELNQVFKQLAGNACRFSPDGGKIVLQARPAGDTVQVTISDQGIGIPIEDQERIFEPFHRLDIGDRRRARGIGLGLTMVREIIALHGGSIQVASAPGEGSKFLVTLPKPGPMSLPSMSPTDHG